MKPTYILLLSIFSLLLFNLEGIGQSQTKLNHSIKTPTCNEANGSKAITDSLNPLFLNGFTLYKMPGMVLVGQGNSFSGLS